MIPAIRFGPGGGGAVSSTAVVISLCIIELMINNQTIEDKKNSVFIRGADGEPGNAGPGATKH